MLLLPFLTIFYRDNEAADIRLRWLYSTGTANPISRPTFHRSRRTAYREYLWIKSARSRLISGLRFRQNRQVGQVYPTSRGHISFGRIFRSANKWEKSASAPLDPRHLIIFLFSSFLWMLRKYKNICSILPIDLYLYTICIFSISTCKIQKSDSLESTLAKIFNIYTCNLYFFLNQFSSGR